MSFPYRGEIKDLTDETRKDVSSGAFMQLSAGVTHYELGGPKDGQPIALIHGFSVPYFIFDPTFEFLTASGFRVLRYDLFGRGWSDRPDTKYNISFFVRQLRELLDKLKLKQVILIGLSMGGPISTAFIDKYPERVSKHILIDPSGVRPVALSGILKTLLIPGVGELIISLFGSENMIKNAASDFFDPALIEHFQSNYRVQMQFGGFKRAVLSSMRNNMLGSFYDIYQRVGMLNKPTLLFWGRNDKTMPFEQSRDILAAIPHTKFHALENCGHIPHYEEPQVVNPILLEFLRK
jgi:pimeloyl-ACP methyl ester carboxylesterase